jgi:hypothetical protein
LQQFYFVNFFLDRITIGCPSLLGRRGRQTDADILNAMESIQTFIKDMHFEEFKEDDNSRLKGE